MSESRKKLLVIGGGRMGEALIGGLLDAGWTASDIAVVEKLDARREELSKALPGVDIVDAVQPCDGAIVAVKPGDVTAACKALRDAAPRRVLSIAAGVTLGALEADLGDGPAVVRAMPNTPAQIGAGASAIAAGTTAGEDDLAWAEELLGAVGIVVRVPEHLLDAVTGLSGSGPAYVFLVAEALIEAGVLNGLPRDTASTLALQTILGSARLLVESGQSPEALRAAVTSPGGTTAAGLRALEDRGVRAAFLDAVTAATNRFKTT